MSRQVTGVYEIPPAAAAPPTKSTTAPSVGEFAADHVHPQGQLIQLTGNARGVSWQLSQTEPTVLGREGTLVIDEPSVSRRHARIVFERNRYRMEDLGSSHGTKLNGLSVEAGHAVPLDNGDVITFARTVAFRFAAASTHGYHSAFISYGRPDAAFATTLYDFLCVHGVKAFFFPETAPAGKPIHDVLFDGVMAFDRLLVVCSQQSLSRVGVRTELEHAFAKAAEHARFGDIIPLHLDDHVETAQDPVCRRLRNVVAIDFRGAMAEPARFEKAAHRLRNNLQKL